MSNKDKIREVFPLASIKNQYYGLFITVPLSEKDDLINLLSDYNLPIIGICGDSQQSFNVTIPKY